MSRHDQHSLRPTPAADAPEDLGSFYAWWRGDPLPDLGALAGLAVERSADVARLADVAQVDPAIVSARFREGHRAYLARLGRRLVAYGWVATRRGSIGELGLEFDLPDTDVYLWDFVTLPQWRGRGVYPRVLQAIVRQTEPLVPRFWIGHEPGNQASARGILKAGFRHVGKLYATGAGIALVPLDSLERAQAAVVLFGVSLDGAPAQGG